MFQHPQIAMPSSENSNFYCLVWIVEIFKIMKQFFAILLITAIPVFVSAKTINDIVTAVQTGIVNPAINFLLAAASAVFMYGIIQYLIGSQGDQAKLDKGKKIMFWGIIGMFIMASAWGIVRILCNFFETCS